mgnify:CR=1 FL=1
MRHFTLLLLSVFSVYQAKADILIPLDKYPTGEKRFNLQINGSHDTSTPWLSTTSFGVDEDGRWETRRIGHPNKSTRTITR